MTSPHPPPAHRLSQRRGSSVAPDPFLQHEGATAASGSSRITIVRIPSVPNSSGSGGNPSNPPSPGIHPRDGFSSSNLARRSSWGSAKSGSSESSGGHGGAGRGRMSFAFATFTPINPPGGGPAAGPNTDRSGAVTPTSSGPPSPASFRNKSRSLSNPSLVQPVPRVSPLTPQQLYEVAQQATNPGQSNPTSPKYGYGGQTIPASNVQQDVQAAPFLPLPSEVYLPFINRPQEVTQQLASAQTGRLFVLLASTFPQETSAGSSISRPGSAMSVRTAGGSTAISRTYSDLPEDSKSWTFSQLGFWLRHVTRQEANDREWIHKIRTCINSRSEVLWQRFAGALGVPPGFEEEEEESAVADEDDFSGSEARAIPVGRTAHSHLQRRENSAPSKLEDELSPTSADESLDMDEEYDLSSLPGSEAVIEPITASSLPPPPGASGLTSPPQGLGLTPGETHALGDVTEEDEEPESESPKTNDIMHQPVSTMPTSNLGSYLGPGGHQDYAPRSHSPLSGEYSDTKRLLLNITNPSTDSGPSFSVAPPSAVQTEPEEDLDPEIDFTEPDPKAEPIQGIRIMNAPMNLFPRLSENDTMVTSPGQFTPPHTASQSPITIPHSSNMADAMRSRSGSNSSLFRVGSAGGGGHRFIKHERTQSFGAFGLHNRSGFVSAFTPPSGQVHPHGPHFPGSFAGVGVPVNNPLLLRNPRTAPATPAASRPAGIPIGAGMHHTPRAGREGFRQPSGLGSNLAATRLACGSAGGLTDADRGGLM